MVVTLSQMVWTFPGGRPRTITIAATAGNVATNKTPGTGKRWLVLRGRITLVCDATAANRYLTIGLTDGTNLTEGLTAYGAITASQTKTLCLGEANLYSTSQAYDDAYTGISPILLEGADQFRIVINAGVAGDSYSGYLVVLEIDA